MRRAAFLVASILVSALFLWLALRDVPLAEVGESIRQAQIGWVIVSIASVALAVWVRAIRWRGLLGYKIPLPRAFWILTITFLLNQLPLRAGEVARSLLATRSGVPLVTAATSIVVERLLDTLMVVVMLAFALSRLPTALPAATQTATLFGVAAILAFALLIFFARVPTVPHRILDWLETRLAFIRRLPLRAILVNLLEGLRPLTDARALLHAVVWTVVSWVVSLGTFYVLEIALGVPEGDRLLMMVMAVTLASFSIAIPVSVAAIGPFEGAVRLAGEAVAMAPVLATSLGFLFHGVTIIAYAILGTLGLLTLGVSLSDVMSASKAEAPPVQTRGQ